MNGATGQAALTVTDNSILWDFDLADGAQTLVTGSTDDSELYLIASLAEVAEPEEPETPVEPEEPTVPETPVEPEEPSEPDTQTILEPHA